jgi:DNA repair protein RadC
MNVVLWESQELKSLERIWTKRSQVQMLTAYLLPVHGEIAAKLIATGLIDRFSSFSRAINAPTTRIMEVEDATARTAHYLHLLQDILCWSTAANVVLEQPILASWTSLIQYCRVQMAHRDVEQFRILFLDKRNRLIADELQSIGTVDHCPVYPREIIKRAFELSATAIVLIHNHPSGDPTPSSADVRVTREIADAARPLGITVHDHLIIAVTGHSSMKSLRLF